MADSNGSVVHDPHRDMHRDGDRAGDRDGDRAGDRAVHRGRFQRGDSGDPQRLASVRIPVALRDRLDGERQRIEPDPKHQRSLDFYAARVFEHGLDWLGTVQPIEDPLR